MVYEPPKGYDDLLADAENHPLSVRLSVMDVPEVGSITAGFPTPHAAAWLALSVQPRKTDAEHLEAVNALVRAYTADGEYERIMVGMVCGEYPDDAVQRIARAIATRGTARPYLAVATLAAITGHHWLSLRARVIGYGIPDPMALPSLHSLLDVTEATVMESIMSDGDSKKAKRERTAFYDRLYRPEPTPAVNGDGYRPEPAGFDQESMDATFDAFSAAARG